MLGKFLVIYLGMATPELQEATSGAPEMLMNQSLIARKLLALYHLPTKAHQT